MKSTTSPYALLVSWRQQVLTRWQLKLCKQSADLSRIIFLERRICYWGWLVSDVNLRLLNWRTGLFHYVRHDVPECALKQWLPCAGSPFHLWYRYVYCPSPWTLSHWWSEYMHSGEVSKIHFKIRPPASVAHYINHVPIRRAHSTYKQSRLAIWERLYRLDLKVQGDEREDKTLLILANGQKSTVIGRVKVEKWTSTNRLSRRHLCLEDKRKSRSNHGARW